jgi:hypothetical protein
VEAPLVPVMEAPLVPLAEAPLTPLVEAPLVPVIEAPLVPVMEAPLTPLVEAPLVPVPAPDELLVPDVPVLVPVTELPEPDPALEGAEFPHAHSPLTVKRAIGTSEAKISRSDMANASVEGDRASSRHAGYDECTRPRCISSVLGRMNWLGPQLSVASCSAYR